MNHGQTCLLCPIPIQFVVMVIRHNTRTIEKSETGTGIPIAHLGITNYNRNQYQLLDFPPANYSLICNHLLWAIPFLTRPSCAKDDGSRLGVVSEMNVLGGRPVLWSYRRWQRCRKLPRLGRTVQWNGDQL